MHSFGYFETESSHHASEYVPYFRKDPETVLEYIPERASMSSHPRSSATRTASATNDVRASTPAWVTAPASSRCSARRSGCLNDDAGSGAAPP
nr:hypothetical protein [Curtobacterium sp. B18]